MPLQCRTVSSLIRLLIALPMALACAGMVLAEGRYTYKEFDGLYVFYKPRDVAAYRQLLPKVFDMPDGALVRVFIADYYKMDAGTQPYLEAAVFLLARYEGETVWHCISMPVTSDEARRLGVTLMGFPKVMGEIALERGEGKYAGTLKLDGKPMMSIKLATQGHVVTPEEQQWFRTLAGIPNLNILNGKVIDPMGATRRLRLSMLEMSRLFPAKLEVKVGRAQVALKPGAAKARGAKPPDAFDLEPSEIVLAYYLKNKLGFSFGQRQGQGGAEK